MSARIESRRENWILIGLFAVALLGHGWLATRNITAPFMPGHEFRQAQTAFTSYFIDRENNFSVLYETPLMGKPWVSILMELPVYEWSVVGLSRLTGLAHVVSARIISLLCFYLVLPPLYWMLRRFGLSGPRRLLMLSLILVCPVYIFYSRAFLMESMELMCCAWFLWAYLEMMDRRRWTWFLAATVAGAGASLIKGSTFAVWLLPAAAYSAAILWRGVRAWNGWGAPLQTIFWGIAGVIVPLGALRLWVELTDPIKEIHSGAWIFTSKNLSQGNWGLVDFAARFSLKTWGTLAERWSEALMAPWLIGVVLVGGGIAWPTQRMRMLGLAAVFFMAQLMFPFAYAYQEYYFYACAVFLLLGLGFALVGLLDSARVPRWMAWGLLLVLPAAQLHTYWRVYYAQQIIPSHGGFSFTSALRDVTPPESVIIVVGADWAAMVPFNAQRRALMIRNGLENDRDYLHRAFTDLREEDVVALVMLREMRDNLTVRELAEKYFELDRTPTFSTDIVDVYCARRSSKRIKEQVLFNGLYGDIKIGATAAEEPAQPVTLTPTPGMARNYLPEISPAPMKVHFAYGISQMEIEGRKVLDAHPDADVWIRSPARSTKIFWEFGMIDAAWDREGGKTDGVELTVTGLLAQLPPRVLYRRLLDPANQPADRGIQRVALDYEPRAGEILHFSCRERGGRAYDWTYWARIEVK